mgnify:CR=1 FL=1
MNIISLILWLILFPLATTINRYFYLKSKQMRKDEVSDDVLHKTDIVEFFVFIIIVIYLIK